MTRFPSTAIDNMLAIRTPLGTILNFNDCNLPARALRSLAGDIGPVEMVLLNYNLANKILEHASDEETMQDIKRLFLSRVHSVNARWIFPFASMHYFRAEDAQGQNRFLLSPQDLVPLTPNVIPVAIGDKVVLKPSQKAEHHPRTPPLSIETVEIKPHERSVPWTELLAMAERYRQTLQREFLGLFFWISPVRVYVRDHSKTFVLSLGKGVSESPESESHADISAHSSALEEWLGKPYGNDALFVGSDFSISKNGSAHIRALLTLGLLFDNGLTFWGVLRLLRRLKGWMFFWNRREEVWMTLTSNRLKIGDRS